MTWRWRTGVALIWNTLRGVTFDLRRVKSKDKKGEERRGSESPRLLGASEKIMRRPTPKMMLKAPVVLPVPQQRWMIYETVLVFDRDESEMDTKFWKLRSGRDKRRSSRDTLTLCGRKSSTEYSEFLENLAVQV